MKIDEQKLYQAYYEPDRLWVIYGIYFKNNL